MRYHELQLQLELLITMICQCHPVLTLQDKLGPEFIAQTNEDASTDANRINALRPHPNKDVQSLGNTTELDNTSWVWGTNKPLTWTKAMRGYKELLRGLSEKRPAL